MSGLSIALAAFSFTTSHSSGALGNPDAFACQSLFAQYGGPVANAGGSRFVEATSPLGANETLDGSLSTGDEPLSYLWTGPFGSAAGVSTNQFFSFGASFVQLTVTDGNGLSDSDEIVITVVDTTPPDIFDESASPNTLWSPNHTMRTVNVSYSVSDIADPNPTFRIVSASSSEPDSGLGGGDLPNDTEVVDAHTVRLRAERYSRAGRTYTITIEATDAFGNSSQGVVFVAVPHNQ